MGRKRVHNPLPADRKSGIPEEVELPAPVRTTACWAFLMRFTALLKAVSWEQVVIKSEQRAWGFRRVEQCWISSTEMKHPYYCWMIVDASFVNCSAVRLLGCCTTMGVLISKALYARSGAGVITVAMGCWIAS